MSGRVRTVPEGAQSVDATGPGRATRDGGPPRGILIGLGVAAIAAVFLMEFLLQPRTGRIIRA